MENETKIVPLQQCYLSLLCIIAKDAGYQTLQHEDENESGTLWFTRAETTTPAAWLRYKFNDRECFFACESRDDRLDQGNKLGATFGYHQGIDDFAMQFSKLLTANRLENAA